MSVNQPEESLTKFEQELTQAMRAVDPPEGFADRTIARAQASMQPRARVLAMPSRRPLWTSGAVAAALLVGVFVGEQAHMRHQREQAEAAQQQRAEAAQRQFEAGIRITDETLDHARAQLARAGIELRD
jgi:type VI protein secretion system component VasF